ncbi:peptidylprolyl isomerase [Aurantiacibacter sediminis]|uniref:Peptidylprolyl isomerase n=2 Tax=Aurantiacibacter sediminis TaxID=2793064 RepID=A0ABS0N1U6_9SPHN|nr:peptidylprolyl isomerase [Aurantiacibacter sediminis]
MKKLLLCFAIVPFLAQPLEAQDSEPENATPNSIVAASSAGEWVVIDPEDLLVMELAPDAQGNPRRVVIQLIPAPFSQPWVENMRTLARANWWDGTSVNRVQDNYVTQWGDVTEEKPLPEGVEAPVAPYEARTDCVATPEIGSETYTVNCFPISLRDIGDDALYTGNQNPGFSAGWPIVHRGAGRGANDVWPIHCYGYVGVGRNYAPDTGTGAELYTIIGQPQRHMDRNLAVVGRIIDGMEHLSSLPRGSGELGFYTEDEAHLRTPILSVRLASEMVDAPSFEYLSTESQSFAAYVAVRANRDDAFYTVPAGGVDICNVEVPIRRVGEAPEE